LRYRYRYQVHSIVLVYRYTYLWVFIVETITVAYDVDALIFLVVTITGKVWVWCFLWRHLSLNYVLVYGLLVWYMVSKLYGCMVILFIFELPKTKEESMKIRRPIIF
jgi:hypothetical protein